MILKQCLCDGRQRSSRASRVRQDSLDWLSCLSGSSDRCARPDLAAVLGLSIVYIVLHSLLQQFPCQAFGNLGLSFKIELRCTWYRGTTFDLCS